MTGKPNQSLKPALLCPIPAIGQPFEHLLIDCVGPLPPSKSGNKFLLTVMCQNTRYPAAFPLRKITTKAVVKALSQFIAIFGIPRIIQSDWGTNFTSKMFAEILKQLRVRHQQSSAYHPQSQGALERFHQTLKALLCAYCTELGRDWEEGVPWLLLAAREVTQSSLGFSPNDLVFGHKVRGPLAVLQDNLKGKETPISLLDYVNGFRRRLFLAGQAARENLEKTQKKMKELFDHDSEMREFSPGDQVLLLLPLPASPFQAKFSGPYTVTQRLSELNYFISTPDRKKSVQLCHVNLLKPYFSRDCAESKITAVLSVSEGNGIGPGVMEEVEAPADCVLQPRLTNSVTLLKLDSLMTHFQFPKFPILFGDTPSRTHLIEHDVDVGDALPIRQHFYRGPIEKQRAVEAEVQYLLDNDLAKPSCSSWASPCLLVKKSDNSYRLCTDYQKVNTITKPDAFPLPQVEDCVDQVGTSKFISKFDLLKGYWQVPLTSRAQEITAFITSSGLYSYSVMNFGLRNAPAMFQRLMNRVVWGLVGCAVYLDDVIIYSDTWEQHLERVRALFSRLAEAHLTVNLAKCKFAKATVVYLGREVGQGSIRPLQEKVRAIEKFPVPSTKKELMRFLGMAGYYRAFCPNFSSVVCPLTNLLKGAVKFVWSSGCQKAFDNVKLLLSSDFGGAAIR